MRPLPEDMYLPSGWSCRGAEAETLSFARDGDRLVVEADRTTDGAHPEFDCPYAWSLTYRQRTGVAVVGGSIGFVTTRTAAIEGLFACMRRINTAIGTGPSVDLDAVLDEVTLRDAVPGVTDADTEHRSTHSEASDAPNHDGTHRLSDA